MRGWGHRRTQHRLIPEITADVAGAQTTAACLSQLSHVQESTDLHAQQRVCQAAAACCSNSPAALLATAVNQVSIQLQGALQSHKACLLTICMRLACSTHRQIALCRHEKSAVWQHA